MVFLIQVSRIVSLFGNTLSDLVPLLSSEALVIFLKYHQVVGLRVHQHLGGRVLEVEDLVSELLPQSLHRDNTDGVARNRNDPLRTLFRAERTRLFQVLIGKGSDMHLAHQGVAQPRLVTQGYQRILPTLLHFRHCYRVGAQEAGARV